MKDNYYSNIIVNKSNEKIISEIEEFSEKCDSPVYVLSKPLGDNAIQYDYQDIVIVLVPGYKVLVIDTGHNNFLFRNFFEDLKDDIGYISKKYEYLQLLGRPREWWDKFVVMIENADEQFDILLNSNRIDNLDDKRAVQLIISLFTGSINDISKVSITHPADLLEAVKKKIVLFDGNQTNFIFAPLSKKRIYIQGLAGTGKTELLLHKIKELYTDKGNYKVCFTCFNKVLASELKRRIPKFFNFMKVEEQIAWNERLFVMSSWGSNFDEYRGVYSYLCHIYEAPFFTFSYSTSFSTVCKRLLDYLDELPDFKPCFDYILIDEGQDFSEEFFQLCEKVSAHSIYIAGDIFQDVFQLSNETSTEPDFMLRKCYRTDPRTLIFSHALSLGLFENPHLKWLNDKEWDLCGYKIEKTSDRKSLYISRIPIKRFDDFPELESSVAIKECDENFIENIINTINEIKKEFPTVQPEDIGIIFLENKNRNYELFDRLEFAILEEFSWKVNKGYVTKKMKENSLFITNRNNVKGLEFPFIICASTSPISSNRNLRNSLYMILTRSFLKSYLLVSSGNDADFIDSYKNCLAFLNKHKKIKVTIPTTQEINEMESNFISARNVRLSLKDLAEEIMGELNVPSDYLPKIHEFLTKNVNEDTDRDSLISIITKYYDLLKECE